MSNREEMRKILNLFESDHDELFNRIDKIYKQELKMYLKYYIQADDKEDAILQFDNELWHGLIDEFDVSREGEPEDLMRWYSQMRGFGDVTAMFKKDFQVMAFGGGQNPQGFGIEKIYNDFVKKFAPLYFDTAGLRAKERLLDELDDEFFLEVQNFYRKPMGEVEAIIADFLMEKDRTLNPQSEPKELFRRVFNKMLRDTQSDTVNLVGRAKKQ